METLITQQSDTLLVLNSQEGRKTYRFWTPLMETYEYAREPYWEFRRGINIETYKDSTEVVESTLVADYAIRWVKLDLWEAKGNVVAVNAKGQILETQQLFWNRRTKKIFSNVDTKITQQGDVIIGVGFDADESFEDFTIRRPRGTVSVDVEPTEHPADSVSTPEAAVAAPVAAPVPAAKPAPALPFTGREHNLEARPLERKPLKRSMIGQPGTEATFEALPADAPLSHEELSK